MDDPILYAIPVVGIAALIVAFFLAKWISGNEEGTDRMREIASYIREGSMAFLMREYRVIGIFSVVMIIILAIFISIETAVTFFLGALFSLLAAFCGMRTATNSNVRTAAAAARNGIPYALKIAFRGGAVMGLSVVGFALLGIGILVLVFGAIHGINEVTANMLTGFGLGTSCIALFGRVGGGIYTKAADVGADLVGKVEAGIPEDDPRNPAVIADNVGDNVGDVAGMGSDLFESYCVSIIAAVVLGATLAHVDAVSGIIFPLAVSAVGILASIVSIFMVGGKNTKNPAGALNFGTYASTVIVLIATFILSQMFFGSGMYFGDNFRGVGAFGAIAIGVIVGLAIGLFTERYTSDAYKSVKGIAKQAETGPGTAIIDGFAVGLISTVGPIMFIAVGILLAYFSAGLYGIALAAVGMLSTTGMVVAVDAYGPIADNAGGIAEMSELPPEVREVTDTLDSVGNTTAAIGKGFAIGSAALTAFALFVSYTEMARVIRPDFVGIDLLQPTTVAGLFIGGAIPFFTSALTMRSVGKAAFEMIEEVRRQFRADKGIMEGTSKPDYAKCVDISTKASLREMIAPGVVAIIAPIACGLILGLEALGGMLAGAVLTGVLLAITMANAGGAWDNAKKHIEAGSHGGKGSDAHKAAVVGDTVGDPFKDTSGPALNTLIKLMCIVAVVFLPLFSRFIG